MSGYCDSNTGPSGPKPDALANCATPRLLVSLSFGTANIDTKNKSAKLFDKILHFLLKMAYTQAKSLFIFRIFHLIGILFDADPGHGQGLPMRRKLCRQLNNAVLCDLDSGKSENDALEDSTETCCK